MRAHVVTTLELENALRRGIQRRELVMHYQPIISLATGKVEGFEALVRWNHPTRGMLLPGEFIRLAEDARLIGALGRFVRQEVCRQLHAWRSAIPAADAIWMSVNVSPVEFAEPDLAREIRALLRETHIPPRRLRIEITETTLMAGDHRVAATLERLQVLQVPLDIDDFGTGYSSLSYLQQLPVSAVKIDRAFVERLGPNGQNVAFIQTMVSLARSLGIPVVAGGMRPRPGLLPVAARRSGAGGDPHRQDVPTAYDDRSVRTRRA
jgi:Amt family ammonium transporter